MAKKRILTGVTTSGIPHLGNYVGAIRPAILASQENNVEAFFFLADYHSLIKIKNAAQVHESLRAVAATWIASGLNYEKTVFYRQSDIPEVLELNWILSTCCAKGLMNRAHAYKAATQENNSRKEDPDHGIEMGLYCYPILMAADILAFNADLVPVGKDQLQHLEMTRDMAERFNKRYKKLFRLPEALIDSNIALLTGLDGRKMSKSYDNTIPLFAPEKDLRKAVMRVLTNSLRPGEKKDIKDSPLYDIYAAFASQEEKEAMAKAYAEGIAWGEVKEIVFQKINSLLSPMREHYEALTANPKKLDAILKQGQEKARSFTRPFLKEIKAATGLGSII